MKKVTKTRVRWRPVLIILGLFVLGWFLAGLPVAWQGQPRVMARGALVASGAIALLLWLFFASGLSLRGRLLAVVALAGAALLAGALFELRGFTGDIAPILKPRFGSRAATSGGRADVLPQNEWPQFLGPRRNGTLDGVSLARDWSTRPPRVVWRRELGRGWSGFAVTGGTAFTQEKMGDREGVVALRLRDGEILWRGQGSTSFVSTLAGDGPRATPALAGGRLFAVSSAGELTALDEKTGEELWRVVYSQAFGSPVPEWGHSGSPLVTEIRPAEWAVVVNPGGSALVAAFSVADGRLLWRGGEGAAGYSSPMLFDIAGERQVVTLNGSSVTGIALAGGDLRWSYPWSSGNPNVAQPIDLGGELLVSSGYGVGAQRIAVAHDAGAWQATSRWSSPRLKAKFTNPVRHRGLVFGLDDGVLVCLDPATGDRRWKSGRYGHGQTLLVGDLLIVQSEDGEIVLVDPQPDGLVELGRFAVLDGKAWNSPAVIAPYLLVRNDREAALVELPLTEELAAGRH